MPSSLSDGQWLSRVRASVNKGFRKVDAFKQERQPVAVEAEGEFNKGFRSMILIFPVAACLFSSSLAASQLRDPGVVSELLGVLVSRLLQAFGVLQLLGG
mmetsp:Transcript_67512/g.147093  ORF Transcript_67512/g.147093 Transcript_67512/m.147093 type:complete len:100 (+) Transcript_67512:838-1137(+)